MKELSSVYDILKVLGHGGFSAVFKARRKADGVIVALKQLDITIENDHSKEYLDFKEEVAILQKLSHPNIVRVFAAHVLDGKPSLEMEFVDGETIESILRREKYFSVEEALPFIQQIGEALNYCHRYTLPDGIAQHTNLVWAKNTPVIHNDINPKNIIRISGNDNSPNRYVLIDFGLSFTDPNAVRNSKKEEGMAEYKSPEKWNGDMVHTPSDIYSLGTVIYELLTGTVPFPVKDYKAAKDMMQLEEKHKTASVPDMCERRMNALKSKMATANDALLSVVDNACYIPQWLQTLVEKCLEKNPDRRFKTGSELMCFYYNGKERKMEQNPICPTSGLETAVLSVEPNFLTPEQQFVIQKNTTTIGRNTNDSDITQSDFAIRTADNLISRNHCQIIKKKRPNGQGFVYQLADAAPSKNGTFYNSDKTRFRLEPHIKINLNDGDYFWMGNTKVVFKLQSFL